MTAKHRPMGKGDIKLIDRVRHTPCLYDANDPNFRLIIKKEEEWQSIAKGLNKTELDARNRWTVLRDRYTRELKQLMLHPDSTEYGKSDFFRRMDFLRKFIKKRERKRKSFNSRDDEFEDEKRPRPLKLYKVKYNEDNAESDDNQVSQHGKSYITNESQYSSNGNFSYDEQEPIKVERNESNTLEECDEQEFHRYEEDAPITYEVFHEAFMLASTSNSSINITENPPSSKSGDSFCIRTAEEGDTLSKLPKLQQRPIIKVCTQAAPPSPQVDMEEYFSKTIALYLRRLYPRYKIKAKVEIMQIIEKYIDLQEIKS